MPTSTTLDNPKKAKSGWQYSMIKTRWVWDLVLLVSFIVVSIPQSTGLAVHEWASVVFVIPFVIHLILHWGWIKKLPATFVQKLKASYRFNIIWDAALYFMMVFVTFSGFLASEVVFVQLGIDLEVLPFWQKLHHDTSNFILPMLGIHLALHWGWIKKATKKMRK
jgi:hypothetical protein